MNTISFDCESDTLTGQTFAVGAVLLDPDGVKQAEFFRLLPAKSHKPSNWVLAWVMPAILARDVLMTPVTHRVAYCRPGKFRTAYDVEGPPYATKEAAVTAASLLQFKKRNSLGYQPGTRSGYSYFAERGASPNVVADYPALCLAFFDWLQDHKAGADVVVDCGHPVEGRFVADCLRFAEERTAGDGFKGPYPLHEVATACPGKRQPEETQAAFVRRMGYVAPSGAEHDPVYDAHLSGLCWLAATRTL